MIQIKDSKHEHAINNSQSEYEARKPDTLLLCFSNLIATLPTLVMGLEMVWLSPMLIYLQSNDRTINPLENPLTVMETAMLAGIPIIVSSVGCFIYPKLADKIGRKPSLLIVGLLIFILQFLLAFSSSVLSIISCRSILVSLMTGSGIINQMYISELCENHNLAKYLCLKTACLPLGNLLGYGLGPLMGYKYFNIFSALLIVPFLLFFLAPETPVYSLYIGKDDECKRALRKLRHNKTLEELDEDLAKIRQSLKCSQVMGNAIYSKLLKTKESRLGLTITLFLSALKYFSGIAVVTSFLNSLMLEAESYLSADTMTMVASAAQLLSLFSTSFIVEKFYRKTLLLISCGGCGISLLLLGVYYLLKFRQSVILSYIQWLPIFCIIFYVVMFGVGLGPIPTTVASEILPPNLIGAGLSIGLITCNVVAGMLLFIYPILSNWLGVFSCMWLFSLNCFVGGILVHRFVPETKGKSIIEIQEILKQY